MTRAVIPESPPILDIDIDINKGRLSLYKAIYQLGRYFTWNPLRVRRASLAAWQAHLNYRQLISSRGLTAPQIIQEISGMPKPEPETSPSNQGSEHGTIAVIGHPYLLYDEHINHRLIQRLEQAHQKVLTPDMLTDGELESATARLVGKAHWTYEEELVGAGEHYLQKKADGVIGIMTFGCGPDSLMMDMVRRQAAKLKTVPFMILTLEEHTAAAGIITRLEAFLDMIQRKKRRQVAACV